MTTTQIIETTNQYIMPTYARFPVAFTSGKGARLYSPEGREYIDFASGIGVNAIGCGNAHWLEAVQNQLQTICHTSNLFCSEPAAILAERLCKATGLDKAFFANSGAEANEGAIKMARKYGKTISPEKVEIIATDNSLHGRTLATLTATGQPKYQKGYEPLPAGFTHVPFGDAAALEAAISDKTCAVLLETIEMEGGVHVPPDDYFAQVRKLCDQHQALLILDEIQAGMGRTGKFYAYEHFQVKPDIVTMAKGLAGGVPIGAFIATQKAADAFTFGDHGTTFGGNALACAAACAVLDCLEADRLVENAKTVGGYFIGELKKLQAKYPQLIQEVRGKGLLVGMKLSRPGKDIVVKCLEKGAVINVTAGDVLRFVPPLNITKEHVDELAAILDQVLGEETI